MKFIKNIKGSLSVEAAIIFGFLSFLLLGAADLSRSVVIKSRLDKLSYEFASLYREGILLDKNSTREDLAKELYEVAQEFIKGYIFEKEFGMVFENMDFKTSNLGRELDKNERFSFGLECQIDDFNDYENLSSENEFKQFVGLSRVSICLNSKSFLEPLDQIFSFNSSSIVVDRK